jgi:hypothetical protein
MTAVLIGAAESFLSGRGMNLYHLFPGWAENARRLGEEPEAAKCISDGTVAHIGGTAPGVDVEGSVRSFGEVLLSI